MNNLQTNIDKNLSSTHFVGVESEKNFKLEELPADLLEAIIDSRERRNLHGPFKTAAEAVASMLED